jgi:hypothetical protein
MSQLRVSTRQSTKATKSAPRVSLRTRQDNIRRARTTGRANEVIPETSTAAPMTTELVVPPISSSRPSQTGSRAGLTNTNVAPIVVTSMVLGQLEKFGGTDEENVETWIGEYENHALVNNWNDHVKALQIGCYLDRTAKSIYETLEPEEKRDYATVISKMLTNFTYHNSSIHFYKKLTDRMQDQKETVNDYAYALAKLFKGLNRRMSEEEKIGYFLRGLKDVAIRSALMEIQPLTFEEAIQRAKKKEICKEDSNKIKEDQFNEQYIKQMKTLENRIQVIETRKSEDAEKLKESKKRNEESEEVKDEERDNKFRRHDRQRGGYRGKDNYRGNNNYRGNSNYRGNNYRNNYRGNNYRGNYRGNNYRGNNFRGNNYKSNNNERKQDENTSTTDQV